MSDEYNEVERRLRLMAFGAAFVRCPHTGTVLVDFDPQDDKIMCGCGLKNPACPSEPRGLHVKRFLRSATLDEYMLQERQMRDYQTNPHAPDPRD